MVKALIFKILGQIKSNSQAFYKFTTVTTTGTDSVAYKRQNIYVCILWKRTWDMYMHVETRQQFYVVSLDS